MDARLTITTMDGDITLMLSDIKKIGIYRADTRLEGGSTFGGYFYYVLGKDGKVIIDADTKLPSGEVDKLEQFGERHGILDRTPPTFEDGKFVVYVD